MKRLPHDSLAQAGFFQKKEPVPQICKPVPVLSLFYSARALAPVIPDSSFFTVGRAVRACMIQPEDIAACVLLADQLPSCAVIEELVICPS
jgi:hypothetical protein